MKTGSALILLFSQLDRHPRVSMEVDAIKDDFNITLCGFGAFKNYTVIEASKFMEASTKIDFHNNYPYLLRKLFSAFIRMFYSRSIADATKVIKSDTIDKAYKELSKKKYSLIIVHQPELYSLAFRLAAINGASVIINAHEYYPEMFSDYANWDKGGEFYKLCKTFFPKAKAILTVTEKIAQRYNKEFGIMPYVVKNSKPFYKLQPQFIDKSNIKIVHHGSSIRSRKIDEMISIINFLPENFTIHLYLNPMEMEYHNQILKTYSENSRVIFHSIIETEKLPEELNKYDIGLFLLPPSNFNYENSLGNKIFEFVQARLCLALSPLDEHKKFIDHSKVGFYCENFEANSMAKKILSYTLEEIYNFKLNSNDNAQKLSSEEDIQVIKRICVDTLKKVA